mgnify:CR=1 FL=1
MVMDAIQVGLGMGSIPGVEVLRHGLRRKHPDIRRQMLVERQRQLLWRDASVGVKIQPKAQRVHPASVRLQPLISGREPSTASSAS